MKLHERFCFLVVELLELFLEFLDLFEVEEFVLDCECEDGGSIELVCDLSCGEWCWREVWEYCLDLVLEFDWVALWGLESWG